MLKAENNDTAAEQFVETGGDTEIAEEMSIKKDEKVQEKALQVSMENNVTPSTQGGDLSALKSTPAK